MTTLKDLVNTYPKVVKVSKQVLASKRFSNMEYTSDVSFPSQNILFHSVNIAGSNVVYAQYFNGSKICTVYLDKDFEVVIVPEEEAAPIHRDYGRYILANNIYMLYCPSQLGSDPEIFVENAGSLVPAFEFLSSKAERGRFALNNYSHIYWDGFQAEFETNPNICLAYQVDSIQAGLARVLTAARKHTPTATLSTATVMDIPDTLLQTAKDEHVNFGCMPSLNAYGLQGAGLPGRQVNFRPAGGHIHFGIAKPSEECILRGVKALDAILAVACVSLFEQYDSPKRRMLYGLPGEYRLPAHGIEYRTLSNAWLIHPAITHLVFDLSRVALAFGFYNMQSVWDATEQETIETIATCDVAKARIILNRNKPVLEKLLSVKYGVGHATAAAVQTILEGMHTVLPSHNIETNWHLLDNLWRNHSETTGCNWMKFSLSVKINSTKKAA